MTLKEYLELKKITHQNFAELIGCSRVAVTLFVNGKTRPSAKLCAEIHKATDGDVTANDHQQSYEASYAKSKQTKRLRT